MNNLLLLTVLLCIYLKTVSSLRCYGGTDKQCSLLPDTKDCGSNEKCQCIKYRYRCTSDDQSCTDSERANQVQKWAYTIISTNTCEQMKTLPWVYQNLSCCSTDGCNRPSNGKCSWSQFRRRSIRRLTDLLEV